MEFVHVAPELCGASTQRMSYTVPFGSYRLI